MKFSSLVPSVLAATGVAVTASMMPAEAALINGADTCTFGSGSSSDLTTSVDCGGYFDGQGNQIGDDGVPEIDQNDDAGDIGLIFGGLWKQVAKAEEENAFEDGILTVTFDPGTTTSGNWSVGGMDVTGYVAVLKGGPSFSAYKLGSDDPGTWNTDGLKPVGNGNAPGLSHFTLYKPVPEPLTILGSATALGIGGLLKREQSKKNKNNKA